MILTQRQDYCLVEKVFPDFIFTGFTKNNLSGNLPQDINEMIGFDQSLQLAYLNQVHSAKVNVINRPGLYEGDALFTDLNNCILAVRTADCLPLFFNSDKLGVVGLLHMGWRPAKEGILDNIPYDLSSFKVLSGVGLRRCCYEVGEEFHGYERFKRFLKQDSGKLYFDPIEYAKNRLFELGLKKDNFFDLDICSLCNPGNFFSFRRNQTRKRTISFIAKRY